MSKTGGNAFNLLMEVDSTLSYDSLSSSFKQSSKIQKHSKISRKNTKNIQNNSKSKNIDKTIEKSHKNMATPCTYSSMQIPKQTLTKYSHNDHLPIKPHNQHQHSKLSSTRMHPSLPKQRQDDIFFDKKIMLSYQILGWFVSTIICLSVSGSFSIVLYHLRIISDEVLGHVLMVSTWEVH